MRRFAALLPAALAVACTNSLPAAPGPMVNTNQPAGSLAALQLEDVDTSARYDPLGRPLSKADSPLVPLPGYNQFWFAWSVFNHGSAVFQRDDVDTADFVASDTCAVPCNQIRPACYGKDCIPALTKPTQVPASSPSASYLEAASWVVGVVVNGEARAYPHNILWWHEIINDTFGDVAVSITHCPLTFSTLAHDRNAFIAGTSVELGVSGRLFNSNLVFYDRADDSLFSQLLGVGTVGPALGQPAPRTHVWEMSWAAWRSMWPATTVLSSSTGHDRDYQRYPYGNYFEAHDDTFSPTDPAPDPSYPNKTLTYGVRVGGAAKAYAHPELAAWARDQGGPDAAPVGVLNETIGEAKVAIVFDLDAGYVQAFDRNGKADLELIR